MTSLHWQTGLQNRQCNALCTLGKTSKCWLGLRPIWVVSRLLWCSESWCYNYTQLVFQLVLNNHSQCCFLMGWKAWLLFVHWTHIGEQGVWPQIIRIVGVGCWSTPMRTCHTRTVTNNLLQAKLCWTDSPEHDGAKAEIIFTFKMQKSNVNSTIEPESLHQHLAT